MKHLLFGFLNPCHNGLLLCYWFCIQTALKSSYHLYVRAFR